MNRIVGRCVTGSARGSVASRRPLFDPFNGYATNVPFTRGWRQILFSGAGGRMTRFGLPRFPASSRDARIAGNLRVHVHKAASQFGWERRQSHPFDRGDLTKLEVFTEKEQKYDREADYARRPGGQPQDLIECGFISLFSNMPLTSEKEFSSLPARSVRRYLEIRLDRLKLGREAAAI